MRRTTMAKTVETYIRQIEPVAMQSDKDFFVGKERSRTTGGVYLPSLNFIEIEKIQEALSPILGETADQVFAIKPSMYFNLSAIDQDNIALATGICPFPMDYNTALNPTSGAGSAYWYDKQAGESFKLSTEFSIAVEQILENPPAISIVNLMKAGCMSVSKTILVDEVDFYTNWILSKLCTNSIRQPTGNEKELAKEQLKTFVREQYNRNTRCFEVMRKATQGYITLEPVLRIEDTVEAYYSEINEQVSYWKDNLPGGESLDRAGLTVAAYYSPALLRAYQNIGIISASETIVIAEGAANLIIPDNGTSFNIARRQSFVELASNPQSPAILAYPSPALTPSIRKQRLEAEPITASPSTLEMDVSTFYRRPKKPNPELLTQPEFQWSLAMPGTPALRELQTEVVMGERDAINAITLEMNTTITRILSESENE